MCPCGCHVFMWVRSLRASCVGTVRYGPSIQTTDDVLTAPMQSNPHHPLGHLPDHDGRARVGLPQHQDHRRDARRRDHQRRQGPCLVSCVVFCVGVGLPGFMCAMCMRDCIRVGVRHAIRSDYTTDPTAPNSHHTNTTNRAPPTATLSRRRTRWSAWPRPTGKQKSSSEATKARAWVWLSSCVFSLCACARERQERFFFCFPGMEGGGLGCVD